VFRNSQKIFEYSRIANLFVLDEIVEKKFEHHLLPLNVLETGRAKPTVLLEEGQLGARIKVRE
jgi:hypothetical protein